MWGEILATKAKIKVTSFCLQKAGAESHILMSFVTSALNCFDVGTPWPILKRIHLGNVTPTPYRGNSYDDTDKLISHIIGCHFGIGSESPRTSMFNIWPCV